MSGTEEDAIDRILQDGWIKSKLTKMKSEAELWQVEITMQLTTEAKAAIQSLLAEARKDQVMQDFLSLSVNSNEDEVVLIGWRDGQLAQLAALGGKSDE